MKRLFNGFLAVFLTILPLAVCFAQTGNRYALVIGNNNYKNGITALSTPVNDANDDNYGKAGANRRRIGNGLCDTELGTETA